MRNLDELLNESSATHGHRCAGQVLGVRMAMVGCREVGIEEPRGCKKLIVYIEMDRCATDAIQSVTGCSLGKRTLKFLDYGKMAATFINTDTKKAVRVLARDDARKLAPLYAENAADRRDAQKQAYRVMPEKTLFSVQPVVVEIPALEMPGYRGERVQCEECGEGINFHREVRINGRALCIPCAQGGLLPEANGAGKTKPKVVLIVGYKKTGKTTLIEKLIPELSRRGYRVGTVKHHHSYFPAIFDGEGTDTWRHRRAGASSVALATPTDIAMFRDNDGAASLDEIVAGLGGIDVVLVEGFHDQARTKIEVLSDHNDQRVCQNDGDLLALVSSCARKATVPTFTPGEVGPLADLIERKILHRP